MNIDSREALATSLLAEVVYNDLPANAIGTTESPRLSLRRSSHSSRPHVNTAMIPAAPTIHIVQ